MLLSIEAEALEFTALLKGLYFINRDVNALTAYMTPQISLLGTGESEISRSLDEARTALAEELQEYSGTFEIAEEELFPVALSETLCLVYGTIRTLPQNSLLEEQSLHITLICQRTLDGMKLMHCHFARPDLELDQGQYYVPNGTHVQTQALRQQLETRDRHLENLMRNIPGGVHRCRQDPYFTLLDMSDSFLSMFGFTREEIRDQFQDRYINMIHPDDRAGLVSIMMEQLERGTNIEADYRVRCKSGEWIWILDKGRLLDDYMGEKCFYCILVEISDRKREKEDLRLSLERFKVIFDQTTDIIFEWDIGANTLNFSANWYKKFGYSPISEQISEAIPQSHNIHPSDIPTFVDIIHDVQNGAPYREAEFRIRDNGRDYLWCRLRVTTQFDQSGQAIKAIGVIQDINDEKMEKQLLMEMAQRDSLTGLYNKVALKVLIEQCMASKPGHLFQVFFIIDIDNFKAINDTFGHLCGDALLSDIANVLRDQFGFSDLVGRIGGDEFLVYLPEVVSQDAAMNKAQDILRELRNVHQVAHMPSISCSIGAVLLPQGKKDYLTCYQQADQALYYQKNNGKDGVTFFDWHVCGDDRIYDLAQSSIGNTIVSENLSALDAKLAQYAFRMLYQSIDVCTAVNQLLEIVGHAYNVSRTYIFENSEDGTLCNNTFEWCAPGIEPQLDLLQGVRYADLGDYRANFDQDGVFYCPDITKLHPDLYDVLAPQNIRSMLQCAIMDAGQFNGYVGFDECRQHRYWTKEQIDTLTLISNVLSVFLTKLRLEQRLQRLLDAERNSSSD